MILCMGPSPWFFMMLKSSYSSPPPQNLPRCPMFHRRKPMQACILSCFSCIRLCVTLWTIALQVPLSMGFSRWESWSGLPCPPPGDLPDPGIESVSLRSACISRWVLGHWRHLGRPARLHKLCSALYSPRPALISHPSFQASDPLVVLNTCESQNTPQLESHCFLPAVSLSLSPLRCSLHISHGRGRLLPP